MKEIAEAIVLSDDVRGNSQMQPPYGGGESRAELGKGPTSV